MKNASYFLYHNTLIRTVCYCLTAAKNHQANRVLPITRQEIVNLTNKEVQNAENIEEITNQN